MQNYIISLNCKRLKQPILIFTIPAGYKLISMNFISKRNTSFLIALCILISFSCSKADVKVSLPQRGGLALTFDDNSIDNWYNYIDLLDSLNVKATFYISNYNRLTSLQKSKLHDIQNRGNEIAFHSTNHVNFLKYKKTEGCEKLIAEEVNKGLDLMNRDGFHPTTFAYPYGKHDDLLDKILIKQFSSIRALNGTSDLLKSLIPLRNNKLIFSLGIDESSKRSLIKIEGLLFAASQTDRCAVMLVHNIERTDVKYQIPLWKLREILITAKNLNLRFYTIAEISR